MSFGFSIGDFLAVIKVASKIRKDFVNAPDQCRQISNELRNLEYTTRDIKVLLSGKTLSKADEDHLYHLTKNCRRTLHDAKGIVRRYSSESRRDGFRRKATRVWQGLMWDPDSIRDIRDRITSSVTSFSSFIVVLNRDAVAKFVEGHEHREHRRDQQEILDWLTPIDYLAQQSDFIGRRQAGTGQWLLYSPEYQHWLATKETLFCPGIPGAGKTILAAIIVDNLLSLHGDDKSVGICVIFLNFRRNDEQKLNHLIASLLKQLARTLPAVPRPVEVLYEKHKGLQTRPTLDELCQALYSVVARFSRVFMVIDALDECQTQDHCRSKFISELLNIYTELNVNILATTRPIPEIMSRFEGSLVKPIRAIDDDIIKYLDGNLPCIGGPVSRDATLQAEVKEGIVQCVDGMFLLAKLHLDSLQGKRSPKAVRSALGKLARGAKDYDTAYDDAMARIQSQLPEQAELGLQTLMWITFTKRPLKVIELRHALGVELGTTEFDNDNLPDLEDILSDCCGLATVDEESDIIRLVHYTMQQYFERTGTSWFPLAQSQIARNCITYLSYDTFESGLCSKYQDLIQRLYTYPFYDYASSYWAAHALLSADYQFCLEFLTNKPKVEACGQVLLDRKPDIFHVLRVTGLHLAALFGLSNVIKSLVQSHGLKMVDYGPICPPIIYAMLHGHVDVVGMFLEMGVLVDTVFRCKTLLRHAVSFGYEPVVRLLLENGARMESKDNNGTTTLMFAAFQGGENIVRMLLDRGAEIDSKDNYGHTALWHAIKWEQKGVERLLRERGAKL